MRRHRQRRGLRLWAIVVILTAAWLLRPERASAQLLDLGETSQAVRFEADTLTWQDGTWTLEGHVRLELAAADGATIMIEASRATLSTERLMLEGATVDRGPHELRVDRIELDPATGRWSGEGLEGSVEADSGRSVSIRSRTFTLDGGRLDLRGARVCPCTKQTGSTGLTFEAERVVLDLRVPGDPEVHPDITADGATIAVGPIPIAYLPSVTYPLDGRLAGALPPQLGFLEDEGFHAGIGAFFPIGHANDLTLTAFARTNGPFGGGTRLRHAAADSHGDTVRSNLEAVLSTDFRVGGGPSWMVGGAGMAAPDDLPRLRWSGTLVDTHTILKEQRLDPVLRLGPWSRPTAVASVGTERSSLEVSAALWQPVDQTRSYWNQDAESLLALDALYTYRSTIAGDGLDLSFDARATRLSVLGEPEPVPETDAPIRYADVGGATHRLVLGAHAIGPWNLGALKVQPSLSLSQLTDLYTVPVSDLGLDLQSSRTRQRWLSDLGLRTSTELVGRPGGVLHRIEPELAVHAHPLRHNFGERSPLDLAERLDLAWPAWSASAAVRQTFWGPEHRLRFNLGAAWLEDVGGVDRAPEGLAGRHLRWGASLDQQLSSLSTRGRLEFGLDGLQEASLGLRRDGSRWTLGVAVATMRTGLRLTGAPWRATGLDAPAVQPIERAGRSALQLDGAIPVFGDLTLFVDGLLPIEDGIVNVERGEWAVGARLGELVGCVGLELSARQRRVPDSFDVTLSANLGGR